MIFRSKIVSFALVAALLPLFLSFMPQEARVNQKKIEREQKKKAKEAVSQYDKAVKRHLANQSKATKKSMKRTKKESRNATPIKR
jgi:hypothetical protein